MEPKYLRMLLVIDVFRHIFTRYGKVTPDDLEEADTKVKTMSYHPSDPYVVVINTIKELAELAENTNPYSDVQIVSICMTIIKNTHDFIGLQ